MSNINWRTINIDALDPEAPTNFDTTALAPAVAAVDAAEVQQLGQQCRQLLRGGDAEGALRGALESAPYGGDVAAKVYFGSSYKWVGHCKGADKGVTLQDLHVATVIEILQSIKQTEMTPMLTRIYSSGGVEVLDTLMKYLYVAPA